MIKNKKEVRIKVYPDVVTILNKYRTPDTTPDDFVFPFLSAEKSYTKFASFKDIDSLPLEEHEKLFAAINSRESLVNRELKKCADWIGITPFSFHASRRLFVNALNESGVKSSDIQQLMNHSSLATTKKVFEGSG